MQNDTRRVVILADPMAPDGDRLRHCYWASALQAAAIPAYIVSELSVEESGESGTVFDIVGTTHLIVSWDAANGDLVYKSDRTLEYFRSQGRVRCAELLEAGGVIISECQTIKAIPVQESYDAIFGRDQLNVLREVIPESERRGRSCTIVTEYAGHPLLLGIPSQVWGEYIDSGERILFAKYTGREGVLGSVAPDFTRSLWLGWITWWKKGWVPLLYADVPPSYSKRAGPNGSNNAVLLVKVEGNGLLIASTLWMAGARCERLIRNLINANIAEVITYHSRVRLHRTIQDIAVGILVGALLIAMSSALILFFRQFRDGWFIWAMSAAGVGFIPIIVTAWEWYRKRVWARPYGVGIWKSTFRRSST